MMKRIGIMAMLCALAACGQQEPAPKGVKVGKPYEINGKTYYPAYDSSYDKTGTASWYGPGFHGKYTANGERFDQNDLTAAHPTLPMPSIVRVTNLENGKSLILRINDRGPFKSSRIIDLSKKSAQTLGIHSLAQVRVQFLKAETEEYIASMQGAERIDMATFNERAEQAKDVGVALSTAPEAEIVESTVSASQPGQTSTAAAPIVSVGSGDLENKTIKVAEVKPVRLHNDPPRPSLIREAAADEVEAPKEEPEAVASVRINANETIEEIEPGAVMLSEPEPATPKVVAVKAPAKPAEASPAAGGEPGYFVQAGSFASEANAQKLHDRLSDMAGVRIEKVDVSGRSWWRVRVGPFAGKDAADMHLSQVREAGVPDARIVQQ